MFGLIYFGSKCTPANFVCKFVDNAFVQLCLYAMLHFVGSLIFMLKTSQLFAKYSTCTSCIVFQISMEMLLKY